VPGASAPRLVRRPTLVAMKQGAVMVDVAIDQGGCFETSRPTTHSNPVYYEEGVLHYCVSNMPAAVPHTSTFALTNATFPYLLEIANQGVEHAIRGSAAIRLGVNIYQGKVTYRGVAESQGRPYHEIP
jgi:alanine dehydrogenase